MNVVKQEVDTVNSEKMESPDLKTSSLADDTQVEEVEKNDGGNDETDKMKIESEDSEVKMETNEVKVENCNDETDEKKMESNNDNEEGQHELEKNPYAYLGRDEFCSERFKIELRNLPRQYGFTELKKYLLKLGLRPHKIKKGTAAGHFLFISFRSDDEREKARSTLHGRKWKNKIMEATFANAAKDPLIKQRAEVAEVESQDLDISVDEATKKVTIPWYDIEYDEQLDKKNQFMHKYLSTLYEQLCCTNAAIKKLEKPLWSWRLILPSPVRSHYRNKCEFSIGYNPETNEKTVGFRLASYKRGSKTVGPIALLPHLPEKMVQAAVAFENFIRQSPYEPYDPETHTGVWRQLTVRTSSQDVMLIVIVSDKELNEASLTTLKKDISREFQELKGPVITTCMFKTIEIQGQQSKNTPELLFGSGFLIENMCGLSFRISPESFFQVNVPGAEVLIEAVQEFVHLDEDTCLLDICCGTGTLGLCLAQHAGEVHGVEIISGAVDDARFNATTNNMQEKCNFYCGKAEDVMDALTFQTKKKKIVAIVDPPRAGVHIKVLQCLRRCPKISTIIYVSCNIEAAKRNFIDFARPESKKYKLEPFIPRKFIPVDLFPLSPHMEVIAVLERLQNSGGN